MKKRVAILGGGLAGVTAAYELAKRGMHEITIYQMGWRLGGKGASGRGVDGRIEEHGLHIWFGFYENSFRLLREWYASLARPVGAPLARIEDAFAPCELIGQAEIDPQSTAGHIQWNALTLPNPVAPGDPGSGHPYPKLEDYARAIFEFIRGMTKATLVDLMNPKTMVTAVTNVASKLIQAGEGDEEKGKGLLARIEALLARPFAALQDGDVEALRASLRSLVGLLPSTPATRNSRYMVDLAGAVLTGLLKDRVFTRGYDALDGEEFSSWLLRHGLEPETLESPFMRGVYDTVFGFRDGDPKQPILAAGTGLRSGLRMIFGYKGAFMYTMQAGMGDVVFTPVYQLLKQMGVRFEFFHRVDDLQLSADKRRIARIAVTRQVDLAAGGTEYDPLVEVKGLACWPSEPRYDQLAQGATLQAMAAAGHNVNLESFWCEWQGGTPYILADGVDFDEVILAIPVASFPHICPELLADTDNKRRPGDTESKWKLMVDKVETMRTMASQVWLDAGLAELGWRGQPPMLGAFQRPLSTYADLSHLIEREDFPAPAAPRHLAYFCGPMHDDPQEPAPGAGSATYPDSQTRIVVDATAELLAKHLWPSIWPSYRPELLHAPAASSNDERLAAQFFRANIDPSERYVLSVPGSTEYRLKADESGYANLTLAGDWIYNGLNAGCVEATVMSGMQAARALGATDIDIVGEKDGELPISFGRDGR